MAVNTKTLANWKVMPHSVVEMCYVLRGNCCLYHQSGANLQVPLKQQYPSTRVHCVTFQMTAISKIKCVSSTPITQTSCGSYW